jgi:hypothetical protein
MEAARVMLAQREQPPAHQSSRYRQHASDVPIERSCRNRLTGSGCEGDTRVSARLVEIRHGIGRIQETLGPCSCG